ncbi:hypothetical protein EGW08_001335 [Elysia chlorotica]|uniref:Cadherin domain-containing protein n=1 Tax=Elysia chlorotica TaxID=188477 RepID=A0A3S1A559_ELYCH|nr:hypothetical protein EGW08_001335 [Elysia chlorotica]
MSKDFLLIKENLPAGLKLSKQERPCRMSKDFLLIKENLPAGSTLMELPTELGETWSITESDARGYLRLNTSEDGSVRIYFLKVADLEQIANGLNNWEEHLSFRVQCKQGGHHYKYRKLVIFEDVNEHPPQFDNRRSYNITITEATTIGSPVFSLHHLATDPDMSRSIVDYELKPFIGSQVDGRKHFSISQNKAHIVLTQAVDYDIISRSGPTHFGLNISATDRGEPGPLTAYKSLVITVTDADDQTPAFVYPDCHKTNGHCSKPYYQAAVKCGYVGPLCLYPGQISAEDRDTQNYTIRYSIDRVDPGKFEDKFVIAEETGEIRVVKPSCALQSTEILLTIRATEESDLQHSETATVQVDLVSNTPLGRTPHNSLDIPDRMHSLVLHGDQPLLDRNYRDSTLNIFPFLTFLILFTSFIVFGACVTIVAVRLSRTKRKREEEARESSSDSFKQTNDLEVEGIKCSICQSHECEGHTDGVTCFRACAPTFSYDTELSEPDLDITERFHHENSFDHSTAQSKRSHQMKPTALPVPCTRREARKAANTETTSTVVSSTSVSTNSSNRSTGERRASESKRTSLKAGKIPITFVPTAITARNGHYRSGLFVNRGDSVVSDSQSSHQISSNFLGLSMGKEQNICNKPTSTNATPRVKRNETKEKEKKATDCNNDESKTQQDKTEDRTMRERLRNRLNKILPQFLRDENPRVRFEDKNIWAFEEETHPVIY